MSNLKQRHAAVATYQKHAAVATYILVLYYDNGKYHIHGLWPKQNNRYKKKEYSTSELDSIRMRLNKFWPDWKNHNAQFWSHEFKKHSTVSLAPALRYFLTTLDLYDKAMKRGKAWLSRQPRTESHGEIQIKIDIDANFNLMEPLKL